MVLFLNLLLLEVLFLSAATNGAVLMYYYQRSCFYTFSTFGSDLIFVILLLKLPVVVLFLYTTTIGPVLTYPTSCGAVFT